MLSQGLCGRQGACRLAAPLGLVVLASICLGAGRTAADPFVYTSSNALAAGVLSQLDGNASVAVAPPAVQLALAALCAGASNGSPAFRQVSAGYALLRCSDNRMLSSPTSHGAARCAGACTMLRSTSPPVSLPKTRWRRRTRLLTRSRTPGTASRAAHAHCQGRRV